MLRRDGRNLVLDSIDYNLAPHIVITPPDYTWDDYFIPLRNRVDPQWNDYLAVPPQNWRSPSPTYEPPLEEVDDCSHLETESDCETVVGVSEYDKLWPLRVFSHEEFAEAVCHRYSIVRPSRLNVLIGRNGVTRETHSM